MVRSKPGAYYSLGYRKSPNFNRFFNFASILAKMLWTYNTFFRCLKHVRASIFPIQNIKKYVLYLELHIFKKKPWWSKFGSSDWTSTAPYIFTVMVEELFFIPNFDRLRCFKKKFWTCTCIFSQKTFENSNCNSSSVYSLIFLFFPLNSAMLGRFYLELDAKHCKLSL